MAELEVGDPVAVMSGEFAGAKGRVHFIFLPEQLPPSEQPRNIGVKLRGIAHIVPFAEGELERIEEE